MITQHERTCCVTSPTLTASCQPEADGSSLLITPHTVTLEPPGRKYTCSVYSTRLPIAAESHPYFFGTDMSENDKKCALCPVY
jgi:hypothetical protein